MNNFAKNLAELIKETKMSQIELASILNVTRQTINRYINGDREPKIDVIIKIAKVFNVSIDDLLTCDMSTLYF